MSCDSINSEQTSARPRISAVAALCLSPVKILTAVTVSPAPKQRAAPDTGEFELFSQHENQNRAAPLADKFFISASVAVSPI
jgi:hypothetical protein